MRMNTPRSTSYRDDWQTPPELFQWCSNRYGPFDVDLCASDTNHLLPNYFTKERSALVQPSEWPDRIFVNPPYGDLGSWVTHFRACGHRKICAVLPASTSSSWFEHVWAAHEVIFLIGRVAFVDPTTNKPSAGNNTGTCIAFWENTDDPYRYIGYRHIGHRHWLRDIRDPIRALQNTAPL